MARWQVALAGFVLGIVAALAGVRVAEQHHQYRLPVIPDTPAVHSLWQTGEWTYCLDARASAYPNFRAQVQQVLGAYFDVLAIDSREVPWGVGCQLQFWMPDDPGFCSGCAANVFYANWPVRINFKWQLGFVYWTGTVGHETGHITGLHEQYIDSGSIRCTGRTDTVMDCGSHVNLPPLGVWFPQPLDVSRLTEWLVPPRLQSAGLAFHEGRPFVWACGGDPHPARATQTVVMYWDVSTSGAFYWSGVQSAVARVSGENAVGGDGCIREFVYCYPGRELYVNQQIEGWPESAQRWYLRGDVYAGTCP